MDYQTMLLKTEIFTIKFGILLCHNKSILIVGLLCIIQVKLFMYPKTGYRLGAYYDEMRLVKLGLETFLSFLCWEIFSLSSYQLTSSVSVLFIHNQNFDQKCC